MSDNFEQIWQEYHDRLLGFIDRRVSDRSMAEDLLQEVFLKIYSHQDTLKDNSKLQSWVYHIARNVIIDHYRSRKTSVSLPETLASPEGESAADRASSEMAGCMIPLIQALPEPYREAVMLFEIKGLPQSEIALIQGISLSGVKSRVQRGRKMLKESLVNCCRFEFDRRGTMIDYEPRQGNCDVCRAE